MLAKSEACCVSYCMLHLSLSKNQMVQNIFPLDWWFVVKNKLSTTFLVNVYVFGDLAILKKKLSDLYWFNYYIIIILYTWPVNNEHPLNPPSWKVMPFPNFWNKSKMRLLPNGAAPQVKWWRCESCAGSTWLLWTKKLTKGGTACKKVT